ncbi:DNA primase [Aestuariibacter halophilus]|uniref:DNA primase n=1 Tax=Fluctibacter halophilus TaxID=226011 RepID=A0ABS8G753_9ALTE|nr:DNA primase [Aestuariibacter halophilus]MCC2616417.1 DNA primase [Aestuariibacter halophilus]
MAGRIPREFIDDLIARTDIVDLVDSRVKLKKAGKNYQACCPFHNEKSPSFTVSQDKQFYHCFGCGAHGNAISFMMEYDRLEFPEAVEELARFHGLDVPREQGGTPAPSASQRAQKEDDYALLEQVARFFAQQLKTHPQRDKAIDYLKGRGLSGEIVKTFEIGYAPPEWDGVLKTFGTTPQRQQQLLDLKVITENDNRRRYDFFRDRIMFPIRDKRGRVIGFGGRVLDDGGPKYLNSPETRVFHKGSELYGYYHVRQHNRSVERVLIVEGYMDVVALGQYDIHYAVASLGTATTPEHVQMLFRTAPEIVCCYDGDRAGREAAWRALENALPYLKDGVQMRFLFLPDGEDPDTQIRQVGKEGFENSLDQAIPLSRFFFESLLKKHTLSSAEGKAALKAQAIPLIEKIQGDHQRAILEEELSKLLGEHSQYQLQQGLKQAQQMGRYRASDSGRPAKSTLSPVRMMIRLLLDQPSLAAEHPQVDPRSLMGMSVAGLDVLNDVHQICLANPRYTSANILEHFRDHPHINSLTKLLASDSQYRGAKTLEHALGDKGTLYRDSFAKLVNWLLQGRMEELLGKSRVGQLSPEEKQELNLLMREQK